MSTFRRGKGMSKSKSILIYFLLVSSPQAPVQSGVFFGTVDCNPNSVPASSSFCIQGMTRDGKIVTPFAIVHPIGYNGSGGSIEIKICVSTALDPNSTRLTASTQRAIEIWNALAAETGQCENCFLAEDTGRPEAPLPFHATTAILHELGHCAMGLDHPNLIFDPPGDPEGRTTTSFTMSYGGLSESISAGPDGIPGSFDDTQLAPGGLPPRSVHWFRMADNNPVVIDDITIDENTYSRSTVQNLPPDQWPANANRNVAAAIGFSNTQTPMYSRTARTMQYKGLTADDVNMVRMGMTGADTTAGTTDDYSVTLSFVENCSDADVQVTLRKFLPVPGIDPPIAACGAAVEHSFSQPNQLTAQHFSIVPIASLGYLLVALNSEMPWDFKVEVFANGFESGDTSDWTLVIP